MQQVQPDINFTPWLLTPRYTPKITPDQTPTIYR